MTDFKIKEAKKKAIPGLFSFWGPQGCGKTLSALLFARGLVGPNGKIGLIDTENERSLFYAERKDVGSWVHLDMQPPFSPTRYSEAFKALEDSGVDVIIIDSASHVWEGTGGVIEQADKATSRQGKPLQGLAKWKDAKMGHKTMMNKLIRSPIPVIFCIRAKDAVKQIGVGKDMRLVSIGWVPICEKNLPYEMTLDLRMTKDGAYDLEASKNVPSDLRDVIIEKGIVTVAMGAKVAQWCGSGQELDKEAVGLLRDGNDAASQGTDVYKKWISTLNEDQKTKIRDNSSRWSKEAKEADALEEDMFDEEEI